MRALYRAVLSGRQVAFLAPTTVLAAQHLRVLRARLPGVRIELMSTIVKRKPEEAEELRNQIMMGNVSVVVGTHALLSSKVGDSPSRGISTQKTWQPAALSVAARPHVLSPTCWISHFRPLLLNDPTHVVHC